MYLTPCLAVVKSCTSLQRHCSSNCRKFAARRTCIHPQPCRPRCSRPSVCTRYRRRVLATDLPVVAWISAEACSILSCSLNGQNHPGNVVHQMSSSFRLVRQHVAETMYSSIVDGHVPPAIVLSAGSSCWCSSLSIRACVNFLVVRGFPCPNMSSKLVEEDVLYVVQTL